MQDHLAPLLINSIRASHDLFLWSQKAYLDPGSGSYLLQLLIAGLLGSFFVVRASWDRVRNFFSRLFSREDKNEPDEQ